MAIELTNEEKLNILNQHLKSIDYNIYGLELDLIEASASNNPDSSNITSLNSRIADANAKRDALVEEKSNLTE